MSEEVVTPNPNEDDWGDNNAVPAAADGSNDDEEDLKDVAEAPADVDDEVKSSLVWKSRTGEYEFALDPYKHSVWVMLLLRFVERAAYYGYTLINPGF